jgi:hypothetical protein
MKISPYITLTVLLGFSVLWVLVLFIQIFISENLTFAHYIFGAITSFGLVISDTRYGFLMASNLYVQGWLQTFISIFCLGGIYTAAGLYPQNSAFLGGLLIYTLFVWSMHLSRVFNKSKTKVP